MFWYIFSAVVYLFALTAVLAFFAGAARLNEQAKANSRAKLKTNMASRQLSIVARGVRRYRDAA